MPSEARGLHAGCNATTPGDWRAVEFPVDILAVLRSAVLTLTIFRLYTLASSWTSSLKCITSTDQSGLHQITTRTFLRLAREHLEPFGERFCFVLAFGAQVGSSAVDARTGMPVAIKKLHNCFQVSVALAVVVFGCSRACRTRFTHSERFVRSACCDTSSMKTSSASRTSFTLQPPSMRSPMSTS